MVNPEVRQDRIDAMKRRAEEREVDTSQDQEQEQQEEESEVDVSGSVNQSQRESRLDYMQEQAERQEADSAETEDVSVEEAPRPEGGSSAFQGGESVQEQMEQDAPELTQERETAGKIAGEVVRETDGQVRATEVDITREELTESQQQDLRQDVAREQGVDPSQVQFDQTPAQYDASVSQSAVDRIQAEREATARENIEQNLESETGVDLDEGQDYTVSRSGDGFTAELTGSGKDKIRGQGEEQLGDFNIGVPGTDKNIEGSLSGVSRWIDDKAEYVTEGSRINIDPGSTQISRSGIDFESGDISIEKTDDTPTAVGGALGAAGFEGAEGAYESGVSSVAEGVTTALNPAEITLGLKEAGEFVGYGVSETVTGDAGVSINPGSPGVGNTPDSAVEVEDEGFVPDVGSAAQSAAGSFAEQASRNPGRTAGIVGGSLVGTAGVMSAANRISTRGGRATAFAIQPGEEVLTSAANVAAPTRVQNLFPGGRIDNEEIVIRETGRAARGLGRAVDRAARRTGQELGDIEASQVVPGNRAQVQIPRTRGVEVEGATQPEFDPDEVARRDPRPQPEIGDPGQYVAPERILGRAQEEVPTMLREAQRPEVTPSGRTVPGSELRAEAVSQEVGQGQFLAQQQDFRSDLGLGSVVESEMEFQQERQQQAEAEAESENVLDLQLEQEMEQEAEQELEMEQEAETEVETELFDFGSEQNGEEFFGLQSSAAPVLSEFGNPLGETGRGGDTSPDADVGFFDEMFGG